MGSLKQRVDETLTTTKVKPGELREIELDGTRSESGHIEGLTDEFEALERISLMGCSLNSLKGLPTLPNLRKLDLSDNKIADGLDTLVKRAPGLTHLHLAGNKIKDVDALKPLAELKALETLELFNCDVANADDYRDKVFGVLPNLFYLDGKDRDGQDAPDDEGTHTAYTERRGHH
jgi:acidic leucine-rich nuclear phosphoprotein 32 family protein A/C/D